MIDAYRDALCHPRTPVEGRIMAPGLGGVPCTKPLKPDAPTTNNPVSPLEQWTLSPTTPLS